MAMVDQRPRETHLATTRYVNTSRTATSAIRAAAVAAGIVTRIHRRPLTGAA